MDIGLAVGIVIIDADYFGARISVGKTILRGGS